MPNSKRLLLFTLTMALFCGGYVLVAPMQNPPPHDSWRHEVGEVVGSAVLWLLAIIYGRTMLKLLLRQGPLLARLLPLPMGNQAVEKGKWLLPWLNKSHPYVGAATVLLIAGHALLAGLNQANLLMDLILFLILWQFACGLFVIGHYQAIFIQQLKRYSYLAHSQLYTGVAIALCALFGHLLVRD